MFPLEIQTLARLLIDEARGRSLRLVSAESCTGGLVAGAICSIMKRSGGARSSRRNWKSSQTPWVIAKKVSQKASNIFQNSRVFMARSAADNRRRAPFRCRFVPPTRFRVSAGGC